MISHTNEIIEKMKESEYWKLNFDFAFKLTNESERGAILIGSSKVEEYLEKLVTTIFPTQKRAYRRRLLDYPGPLSSFSGKLELLYAFRLIDEQLYNALNTLRKIRNSAAHSYHLFSLKDLEDEIEGIYEFEQGFSEVIHKLAYKDLIRWKLEILKVSFEKEKLTEYDYKKLWEERVPNPEENKEIQEQLLVWKLAYGLTILCIKIEIITQKYSLLQGSDKIWLNILDELK